MGETHQEGPGSSGSRPARPTPTPSPPGSAVLTPPTGLPAVGTPTPSVPQQRTAPEPTTPDPTTAEPTTPEPTTPELTRQPARETPPAPPSVAVRMCTCGHPEEMHEHYRAGDDCGACGPRTCASFTDGADDAGPVRRVFRRLLG